MKSIISVLVVLAFAIPTFSQETNYTGKFDDTSKNIKLPAVVIKKVGEDFSVYLPEIENQDSKINYIQNTFIAYDLGKDLEGYDNFLVYMDIKDASLVATYNEKGKLIKVVEKYDNVRLPNIVLNKILKEYPNWRIIKDRYSYSQEEGDVTKKHYDVLLEKNNQVQKIVIASNGEFIKRKTN
ncbi:hypothetical protein [Flavobacterium capsici]|uniref:Nicotinate-nucleotide adenylyltransferase n=1 Tax=Flavobacterium capsici TaxID=3075618 RepID=A0AA96EVU3_9FLAO|nr:MULTISPECIES: hypothetical protein [unclassified Flavobacterium]WNM19434.1 hypothetical protein RN608_01835 [Flavobacterium sp. PMR2A8]WNM20823.1 hypothetical protein RN605_09005 [Flavobacterium sp. PMTSA4]